MLVLQLETTQETPELQKTPGSPHKLARSAHMHFTKGIPGSVNKNTCENMTRNGYVDPQLEYHLKHS